MKKLIVVALLVSALAWPQSLPPIVPPLTPRPPQQPYAASTSTQQDVTIRVGPAGTDVANCGTLAAPCATKIYAYQTVPQRVRHRAIIQSLPGDVSACPTVDRGLEFESGSLVFEQADGGVSCSSVFGTSTGTPTTHQGQQTVTSITPQQFGAVGDGTNDDTTAIQAALNVVIAAGGDLYFPCGTYKTSVLLVINNASHVTIRGKDRGCATIGASTPINIMEIMGVSNYITIQDLTFRGASVATEGDWGIFIPDTATVDHVTIRHNHFTGTNNGTLLEIATDSSFVDNVVDGLVDPTGVQNNGYGLGPGMARNLIQGNKFANVPRHSIYAGGGMTDTQIVANTFAGNGCLCPTPTCEAIAISSLDWQPPNTRNVIMYNAIVNSCGTGIGFNYNSPGNIVAFNTITGTGGRVESTAASISLNGTCLPAAAGDAGGENPDNTVIVGNVITGFYGGAGIVASCVGGSTITNNFIRADVVADGGNGQDGIRIAFVNADGGGGNVIDNNIISGPGIVAAIDLFDNGGNPPYPQNTHIGLNWCPDKASCFVNDTGRGTTTYALNSKGDQSVDGGINGAWLHLFGSVQPGILGPPGFNLQIQSNTGEPLQLLVNNGSLAANWDTSSNMTTYGYETVLGHLRANGYVGADGIDIVPESDTNVGCTGGTGNCSFGGPHGTDTVIAADGGEEVIRAKGTDRATWFSGAVRPVNTTFAGLPANATNGYTVYCTDCAQAVPCTGGGSGAMAMYIQSQWSCTGGRATNTIDVAWTGSLTSPTQNTGPLSPPYTPATAGTLRNCLSSFKQAGTVGSGSGAIEAVFCDTGASFPNGNGCDAGQIIATCKWACNAVAPSTVSCPIGPGSYTPNSDFIGWIVTDAGCASNPQVDYSCQFKEQP